MLPEPHVFFFWTRKWFCETVHVFFTCQATWCDFHFDLNGIQGLTRSLATAFWSLDAPSTEFLDAMAKKSHSLPPHLSMKWKVKSGTGNMWWGSRMIHKYT